MPKPSKRDQLMEATKELLWEVATPAGPSCPSAQLTFTATQTMLSTASAICAIGLHRHSRKAVNDDVTSTYRRSVRSNCARAR
jgi:hypothetical protein